MSTATAVEQTNSRRAFTWSRLGSLLSILPLGVWTVNHLWDNLAAFAGAEAWERQVTHYQSPVAMAVTLVIVLLPLLIHTLWGIQRVFSSRPNYPRYGQYYNLKYLVQRVAGVGVLFFLGAHIWLALIEPRLVEGHAEPFADIAAMMRWHWQTTIVYLLGTLGVAYHLANGLHTWAWTWGIIGGNPKQRWHDVVFWIVFLGLLAMSWGAIYALYSAGEQFPIPPEAM